MIDYDRIATICFLASLYTSIATVILAKLILGAMFDKWIEILEECFKTIQSLRECLEDDEELEDKDE